MMATEEEIQRTSLYSIPKNFKYPPHLELPLNEAFQVQNYYVRKGRGEKPEELSPELVEKLKQRNRFLRSKLVPRHDTMAYPIGRIYNRWEENISDFNCNQAPRGNDLVLVIGCNEGWEVERLQKHNKRVIGVDIVPSVIEYAKKERGLEAYPLDMHHLAFKDESFDMVFIKGTLEHSHKPLLTLREIYRVLKPGGAIYANLPPDLRNPAAWDGTGGAYEFTHQWKANVPEIYDKIVESGFIDITMAEVDLREFKGEASWPPSYNYEIIVLARKPNDVTKALRLTT